jgi:hypothetical protein
MSDTHNFFITPDIFELYGTKAKQYDCLMSQGCKRYLTQGEQNFCNVFTNLVLEIATVQEMEEAHKQWMQEEQEQPKGIT